MKDKLIDKRNIRDLKDFNNSKNSNNSNIFNNLKKSKESNDSKNFRNFKNFNDFDDFINFNGSLKIKELIEIAKNEIENISKGKNKTLKKAPIEILGLSGVGVEPITYSLENNLNVPILLITYNELQARNLFENLKGYKLNVKYFPKRDILAYDYIAESKENAYQRMDVLIALNSYLNSENGLNISSNNQLNNRLIVVASIESLMQPMISKEVLFKNILNLKVGESYNFTKIKEKISAMGYEKTELVEAKGQFSTRGDILDICFDENIGVRIEFWGDEIDSIRRFSLANQRTIGEESGLQDIKIYPVHEYLLENDINDVINKIKNKYFDIGKESSKEKIEQSIENSGKNLKDKLTEKPNEILTEKINENPNEKIGKGQSQKVSQKLSEKQKEILEEDIELIKSGDYISKIDKYFDCFYENISNLFEYFSSDYLVLEEEPKKIITRAKNILNDNEAIIKSLIEKNKIILSSLEEYLTIEDISEKLERFIKINLFSNDIEDFGGGNKYYFKFRSVNYFKKDIEKFFIDIQNYVNLGKNVYITLNSEEKAEKLKKLLDEKEINSVKLIVSDILQGFEETESKIILINANDLIEAGKPKKKRSNKTFNEAEQIVFSDLKTGDYIVHRNYGIGVFEGIHTIKADGVTKDYLKIEYKDSAILYVPTDQLDDVKKYIGGGESNPKINRLGSKDWEKTKNKVKNNLREVAQELIELYAKRQKMSGYAFSKDTPWQEEFENSFEYEPTEDQLRCTEEIKKDMESSKPMDRLLCGDVGYGKTEVAMRAAFKAVIDGKQVAYLAPTTILSEQQYKSFKERMKNFPVRIEVLNRFRTAKEQKKIIRKLKLGEIDILIGTHRILSKDIVFKDLGFLIIDEEHRFGVKDKEKIKEYKSSIDVLTMTATPIPRTLHMSIIGVRDMSIIYDPPQNRKPVQTYVLEYDIEVVREAITKELERNGQVFYLFNNVSAIPRRANEISKLVPEAKVEFAHGKMTGSEIEEKMQDFVDNNTNVLVCTTILESGIDIPNANTIIIENADRLGLAQLYQIRGRVGRSNTQGYAYITYKRDKMLSEEADKRLKAMKEFTEFGSGFKIAMRDLEIRGAGSMLGEIQHGHMEQVGYDTYCKLLDQVIKEMKNIPVEEEEEVQIDLNVSSYIPDKYIEDSGPKIKIYQDIALCRTEENIQEVIDEMIDIYGNMPKEVENLLEIARIKELAKKIKIRKIQQKNIGFAFYFGDNKLINDELIKNLVEKYGNKIRFSNTVESCIIYKLDLDSQRLKSQNLKSQNDIDKFILNEIKNFLNFILKNIEDFKNKNIVKK